MPLLSAQRSLVDHYDVVLLDLDGVVYVGSDPVPEASQTVARLRESGVRLVFVTNNAARSPSDVAVRLERMGIPAGAADVVTSAQAAARMLADRLPSEAKVLVLGAPALTAEVVAVGLTAVRCARDEPDAVVNGYDGSVGYAEMAEAALAIRQGAWWVSTNLDATIPTARGLLPGNGAVTALLAAATDRHPVAAGKPAAPLLEEAVRRAGGSRPLMVGDRLDTDIAGANGVGYHSLAVLTGVADATALLAARPAERPTYLAADLAGLLEPHPQVTIGGIDGGEARCARWSARLDGDALRVTGSGRALDALRAAATAAWAYADAGGALGSVDGLPRGLAATPGPER